MQKLPAVVATVLLAAPGAQAEPLDLSFGVTAATEYVSSGIRYTDGPTVQPYVELGFGSFYAGAYVSNLDADLTLADLEYGLSLGYRGESGSLSYDLGFAYYLYDEAFEDTPVGDYAEAIASATFAATDALYLTAEVAIAPEFDQTNVSLTVDYYTPVEGLAVGATYGRLDADYGAWSYWSVGTTYQVAETVGVGLAYHDSNVDPDLGLFNSDGLLVASVSFDFSLR